MASVCMPQANYQQQQPQHHRQFQLHSMNSNIMLLQQQQQQQQVQYGSSKNQPIAPAQSKVLGSSNLHNIHASAGLGPMMLPKKKYTYATVPYGEQLPSVARRNARERNRVKQVNNGFSNLRQHLPQTVINALSHGGRGASKKLSKVDTLRIALEYIRGLQDLLEDSQYSRTKHADECSDDGSNYAYSAIGSPVDAQYQQSHCYDSEASASPTPSYTDSDISIGGVNYLQPVKLEVPQQQQQQQQEHFKFEVFEDYSPLGSDEQPDDEELLDYISSWQEQ